jgi:hypothetical protein
VTGLPVAAIRFFYLREHEEKKMDGKKLFLTMLVTTILVSCFGAKRSYSAQEIVRLMSNYPNPFDSRSGYTTIVYNLVTDSMVEVKIYDLFGNPVRQYPSIPETAGQQQIIWDGTDDDNRKVAKGGYICVVEISSNELQYVASRKIGVLH